METATNIAGEPKRKLIFFFSEDQLYNIYYNLKIPSPQNSSYQRNPKRVDISQDADVSAERQILRRSKSQVTRTVVETANDMLASLFSSRRRKERGRKRRKSCTTPYLHIKKAIRRTRLCKRRGWLRVPAGDEKNSEIRALINLLSGTADRRRRSEGARGRGGRTEGESSDEIFVGLSSLSRGLSQAAREFKVLRPLTSAHALNLVTFCLSTSLGTKVRAKIKIKSILTLLVPRVFTHTRTGGWDINFRG